MRLCYKVIEVDVFHFRCIIVQNKSLTTIGKKKTAGKTFIGAKYHLKNPFFFVVWIIYIFAPPPLLPTLKCQFLALSLVEWGSHWARDLHIQGPSPLGIMWLTELSIELADPCWPFTWHYELCSYEWANELIRRGPVDPPICGRVGLMCQGPNQFYHFH